MEHDAKAREPGDGVSPISGEIIAVHGSVFDVRFPASFLPAIDGALAVEAEPGRTLVAEVQLHLASTLVRAVALENTAGLKRASPHGPQALRCARPWASRCLGVY